MKGNEDVGANHEFILLRTWVRREVGGRLENLFGIEETFVYLWLQVCRKGKKKDKGLRKSVHYCSEVLENRPFVQDKGRM